MQKLCLLACISVMVGCATTSSEQSSDAITKPGAEASLPTKSAPQKAAPKATKPTAPQLAKAPPEAAKQEVPLTYMERVHKRILRKAELPADIPRSLAVTFVVTQSRDGEVLNIKLKSSSGYPPYDSAMENAIRRSSPLPKAISEDNFKPELILDFRSNQSV